MTMPLWGVFFASFVSALVCAELGFRAGSRRRERTTGDAPIRTGPFAAATLSLAAFTLALMFGAAESRLNGLKKATMNEISAIGAVYQGTDLLADVDRAAVRELLVDYVVLRLEPLQTNNRESIDQANRRAAEVQASLWALTAQVVTRSPTVVSALFVETVKDMVSTNAERSTLALRYRLPPLMWAMLCGLSILGMTIGGYESGLADGRRYVGITAGAALAFSAIFIVIVAMDRPDQYLSSATRADMISEHEELLRSMGGRP